MKTTTGSPYAILLAVAILPQCLPAATRTWDGGDLFNTNWTDADNWTGFLAPPVAGDALVFPSGVALADRDTDNNFTAGTDFAGLTFNDSGYTVAGNSFDLSSGGITLGYGTGTTSITPGFRLTGSGQTIDTGTGSAFLTTGILNLNGNSVTLTGSGLLGLAGLSSSSGTPTVTKNGTGILSVAGFNNQTWSLNVNAGTFLAEGFLAGTGTIAVASAATMGGNNDGIAKPVTINGFLAPGTPADATQEISIDDLSFSIGTGVPKRLTLDVTGAVAGDSYDFIDINNSLTLNNATLALEFGAYKPPVNQIFTFVNMGATATRSGTFSGIGEGAQVMKDGQLLEFSYVGGTGNDFTGKVLNQAPVADSQSVTTNEDIALPIALTASDPNPQTLTYTILSNPANGILSGTGVNRTYTPNANFNGSDSFTFRASDGTANSNTATITITVSAVNDPPSASNLSVAETYTEDTAKNLADIVIVDPDSNVTATLSLSNPSAGSLNIATSGTVTSSYDAVSGEWSAFGPVANVNTLLAGLTFTPAANFNSSFTIATSVSDGAAPTNGSKSMSGIAVNDAPVVVGITITTNPNQAKTVTLAASDPDDSSFTFSIVTPPSHGTITQGTGAIRTYTPTFGYFGTDSFVFRASDGHLQSNDATITILINSPPTISDIPDLTLDEDTASGVIPFEIGDDQTAVTSLVLGRASSNTNLLPVAGIVLSGSGSNREVAVTPVADKFGTATVTITVDDGSSVTSENFVLTVNPIDDPPVAVNQNRSLSEDTSVNITFPATDADGQTLTYAFPTGPISGVLSGTGNARTYTPAANFSGSDSFTFTASDGVSTSPPANVILNVTPVNDMPSFTKGIVPTVEANSGPQSFPTWAKNIDDGDPESEQSLTFNVTNDNNSLFSVQPAVSASGNLTFTPATNAFGKATVSVSLTDDNSAGGAALTTAVQTFNLYIGFLPPVMTVGGAGAQFSSLTNPGGAFSAINTRTQRENLVVRITGDLLSETGAVSLNTPFVEPAGAEFSITIVPSGAPRQISSNSMFAVIRLNGVDRVTIDGSLEGAGADRSLTITSTDQSSDAVVWIQNSGANGASFNTIRNLNLVGGGETICGIGSGGGTISLTSNGAGNHSNTFSNNTARRCEWGIYSGGSNAGTIISNNDFTASGSDRLTQGGILVRGETNPLIAGNRIANVTAGSSLDVFGISLGLTTCSTSSNSGTGVTGGTVAGNTITGIANSSSGSAVGIAVARYDGPTLATTMITNNSIASVGSFGSSNDLGAGVLIGGGSNSRARLLFNSISISGAISNLETPGYNFAVAIAEANPTVELKNNVLSNVLTNVGSSGTSGRSYLIGTSSATFSGLTSNNNDLFLPPGTGFRTGRLGSLSSSSGSDLVTLTDWKLATSQDATSFAAEPMFNSMKNLRPLPGSPLLNAAFPMPEASLDLTGTSRNATTPTIGAFEFAGDSSPPLVVTPPLSNTANLANRTLSNVAITDFSGVATDVPSRPRLYFRRSMDANTFNDNTPATSGWKFTSAHGSGGGPFSFVFDYSLLPGSGVVPGDVIEYFIVAQDLSAASPNVGNEDLQFASGLASVQLSGSAFPVSGQIQSYRVALPISGVVTVGLGGDFPSLTLPGGLFEAINQRVLTGSLEARIVSNLPSETGAVALNAPVEEPLGSLFSILVHPTGTARSMSGAPDGALIRLKGVDRFILDGSLNGSGTDRSLSITATGNGYNDVVSIFNVGTDGATDNVIRNLVITGSSRDYTMAGVSCGAQMTPAHLNHRNLISNNLIKRARWGVYLNGLNDDNVVSENEMNGASPDNLWLGGIYIGGGNRPVVNKNVIRNIGGDVLGDQPPEVPFGITIGMGGYIGSFIPGIESAVVSGNVVHGVSCLGGSAVGIAAGSGTIINNSVSGVRSISSRSSNPLGGVGILVGGGSDAVMRVLYNSVYLSGAVSFSSFDELASHCAIAQIREGDPGLELKNNIFSNTLVCTGGPGGVGPSFAICTASSSFSRLNSDHNVFHVGVGSGFRIGRSGSVNPYSQLGSDHPTLIDWQNFTLRDVHSISVDPQFSGLDNLMLPVGSPLSGAGIPLSGFTTDILGNPRNAATPTIGAYELDVSLTTVEHWRLTHFGTISNTGNAADLFDFDKDGIVNLIEFAFGLNPTLSDSHLMPQPQRIGNELVYSFATPPGVAGVIYGAETSDTLAADDWQPVPDTGTAPNHEFKISLGARNKDFVRLTITGQAEELAMPPP